MSEKLDETRKQLEDYRDKFYKSKKSLEQDHQTYVSIREKEASELDKEMARQRELEIQTTRALNQKINLMYNASDVRLPEDPAAELDEDKEHKQPIVNEQARSEKIKEEADALIQQQEDDFIARQRMDEEAKQEKLEAEVREKLEREYAEKQKKKDQQAEE